jgi:hypothetical protein
MAWTAERATEIWFFANAANRASLLLHHGLGFREVTRDFTYPGVTFTGGTGVLCRAWLTANPPTPEPGSWLRVVASDDAVQGGDVASVGGPAGRGEAQPDPLASVAHRAALVDVAGFGEY